MSWWVVVVLAVGAFGCKAFGVGVLARAADGESGTSRLAWLPATAALIPPALFAALIAVQTLEIDGALQPDARLAGVAAGAVAVWRKVPFVGVVAVAMAVTAVIRWQT